MGQIHPNSVRHRHEDYLWLPPPRSWLARIYQVVRGTAQLGVGAGVPDQSREIPAVRLWWERELVQQACREALGISRTFPAVMGSMEQHSEADSLRKERAAGRLPVPYADLVDRLARPGDDRWTEAVDRLQTEMGPRRDRAATVDNEVHSAGSKQGISHNVIEAPRAIIERPITRHEPTSGCTSPRWPPLDGAVYRYRPTGEWSWAIRGDFLAPDR